MNQKVMQVIDSEVEYAKGWDTADRSQRPQTDSEKSVEFWILHIRRYLEKAQDGCSGMDKTDALVNIRKIAALCVRCMENNDTPMRESGKLKPY